MNPTGLIHAVFVLLGIKNINIISNSAKRDLNKHGNALKMIDKASQDYKSLIISKYDYETIVDQACFDSWIVKFIFKTTPSSEAMP